MTSRAKAIMDDLNPNAVDGEEGGKHIFIEDVTDPDGRFFRLEYRCDTDGSNATAFCRYNPWGGNPYDYDDSHLGEDGFICYATGLYRHFSPYGLKYAVERCRYWCALYSYFREHGYAATCADFPEWGRA